MLSYFRRAIACSLMTLYGCGSPPPPAEAPPAAASAQANVEVATGSVAAAIAGSHRSDEHRARDGHRHPEETLAFFGLEPDMTVVEIWPGGRAWYTEVLAPVVRGRGKLIAATLDPDDTSFRGRFAREFRKKMAATPEVYDEVETTILYPPNHTDIAPPGTVDLILSFRSVHNWIRWEGQRPEPYFAAVAAALKPGGIFGVVQHRAPEDSPHAKDGTLGYVSEAYIISLAEGAGLKLDGRSEVNANAKDDHDHPEGVWTLPPTLRLGDTDRDVYRAIGESDRMTLKFVKPAE